MCEWTVYHHPSTTETNKIGKQKRHWNDERTIDQKHSVDGSVSLQPCTDRPETSLQDKTSWKPRRQNEFIKGWRNKHGIKRMLQQQEPLNQNKDWQSTWECLSRTEHSTQSHYNRPSFQVGRKKKDQEKGKNNEQMDRTCKDYCSWASDSRGSTSRGNKAIIKTRERKHRQAKHEIKDHPKKESQWSHPQPSLLESESECTDQKVVKGTVCINISQQQDWHNSQDSSLRHMQDLEHQRNKEKRHEEKNRSRFSNHVTRWIVIAYQLFPG